MIHLVSILWASFLVGMGLLISHNHLLYNLDVVSSLSSGVEYQFIWFDCSEFGCESGFYERS